MKLDAEERPEPGANPFIGSIVEVDEPRLTVSGQGAFIDRKAVVLAGDITTSRQLVLHRLVDASVTIRKLAGVCSCGQCQNLVPQTDSENGLIETGHDLL